MNCKKCNEEIQKDGKFCPACGEPVKKKDSLLTLIWLFGTVLLVVAAIFILNPPANKHAKMVYYVKDNTLYGVDITSLQKNNVSPMMLTEQISSKKSLPDLFEDLYYLGGVTYMDTHKVTDNEYGLFYPENMKEGYYYNTAFSLMLKEAGADKATRIATNVGSYMVLKSGVVIYHKEDDSLYLYQDGKSKKLSKEIWISDISEDESKFLWTEVHGEWSSDGTMDLYMINLQEGTDKKLLAEDTEVVRWSDDFSSILVRDPKGTVSLIKDQGEPQELVQNVDEVIASDDSGQRFYYLKNTISYTAMDFVEDDLIGREVEKKETTTNPEDQTEVDSTDTFEDDLDLSNDKESTYQDMFEEVNYDNLREELIMEDLYYTMSELYYYDNGQETLIEPQYNGSYTSSIESGETAPYCISYYKTPGLVDKKWKLSEVTSSYDIVNNIDYRSGSDSERNEYYMVLGSQTYPIDSDVIQINFNEEKQEYLYLQLEDPEDSVGYGYSGPHDLFSISYAADSMGKITELDQGVSSTLFMYQDQLIYTKDQSFWDSDNILTDLYADGQEIATDVYTDTILNFVDEQIVMFIGDGNGVEKNGSLIIWNGQEMNTIAENVNSYDVISTSDILLMTDYDYDDYMGNLKYYDGKTVIDVDTDVTSYSSRERSKEIDYYAY